MGLGAMLAAVLYWGFTRLPGDSWQFLFSVPERRLDDGGWGSRNFTFYGFFVASANTFAVAIAVLLLGSVSVRPVEAVAITLALLGICIPASKIVAWIVEKKRNTFTVGGALFVGILVAPWLVLAVKKLSGPSSTMEVLTVCAAVCTAYGFGEGLGRLACISFGCCYGKPMSDVPPWLDRLFGRRGFVFQGKTKKIAYAGSLEGQKVFPIQALTAVLYNASALLGTWLFLAGFYGAAMVQVLVVTQVWRIISETLRDDYRGGGKISAYQIMMGIALVYSLALPFVFPPSPGVAPALSAGWRTLWTPGMILSLQTLWALSFLYYGKSRTTGSRIHFHVNMEEI